MREQSEVSAFCQRCAEAHKPSSIETLDLLVDDSFAGVMSFGISKDELIRKLVVIHNRTVRSCVLEAEKKKAAEEKKAQGKEALMSKVLDATPKQHIETIIEDQVAKQLKAALKSSKGAGKEKGKGEGKGKGGKSAGNSGNGPKNDYAPTKSGGKNKNGKGKGKDGKKGKGKVPPTNGKGADNQQREALGKGGKKSAQKSGGKKGAGKGKKNY